MRSPDFEIDGKNGIVSKSFNNLNIKSFTEACKWVERLDYKRNLDKNNKLVLFDELCGTCSTKHALLKRLAEENGSTNLKLVLGIFAMSGKNTPSVKNVLDRYKLKYIPEAHNYLQYHNHMFDFTGIGVDETKFKVDLLEELEISSDQITDYKVQYHKEFLSRWIETNKIPYTLDKLWEIREECIAALAKN